MAQDSRTDHRTDRRTADVHVLVVEDEPADAGIVLEAIRAHGTGIGAEVIADGESAIERVGGSAGSPPVSLILLDLHLPGCSGTDVLARVRQDWTTRQLPVVVLTGLGSEEDARRCYELGANAVVVKPLDLDDFVDAVGRVLHFWLDRTDDEPGGSLDG